MDGGGDWESPECLGRTRHSELLISWYENQEQWLISRKTLCSIAVRQPIPNPSPFPSSPAFFLLFHSSSPHSPPFSFLPTFLPFFPTPSSHAYHPPFLSLFCLFTFFLLSFMPFPSLNYLTTQSTFKRKTNLKFVYKRPLHYWGWGRDWNRVSVYIPGCSGTHTTPVSTSWGQELQICTIMSYSLFKKKMKLKTTSLHKVIIK